MSTKNHSETATLVAHDFSQEATLPFPASLEVVGKVVHWNGTPNFTEVSVLMDPGYEVKPGQFLAVWHGQRKNSALTVIQVTNCSEVNPNENPELAVARERLGLGTGYAGEGVSTRIFRLSSCDTIEEFEVEELPDGNWKTLATHAPEALSRAGDKVVLLPAALAAEAIGSLPNPAAGVHLGETYGPSPVEVTLNPQVFQMHTGVFGNPGKGKSYLSGIFVEEAFAWDIPMLVIDVNGETVDAAAALGGEVITLPNADRFGLSLSLITPPELVSITPNVRPNTQYADLIELAHDQLRNEFLKSSASNKEIPFSALKDRIEALGKDTGVPKASIAAAYSRISVLERDPLIGKNFDFIAMLKQKKIVVLDCRYLSLRQTRLIAATAARVLQQYGRQMSKLANENNDAEAAKWFAVLYVDEAHAIVPNNDDAVSTQVLYELARMGRHVRTGLILSSQSPSDLDSSVLKRLQTRFVFALEQDQLRSISGVIADLNEKIIAQLPKLPRGICAVSGSSEIVRHGFLLKVKERKTPVGGTTPPIFKSRAKKEIKL